jgi:hypothetical protein
LLSAGIEFDLVFEAHVGSDGSVNDIRLVSARGLTDVAQRWLDNKGIRETELARITSELGRWRIEPPRNVATDTDKMRKLVEVRFRYRLLGSDTGKCDYPSSCTCRYEIQQTADGIVVSIFAVKATVME